jgi:hypothetical protein
MASASATPTTGAAHRRRLGGTAGVLIRTIMRLLGLVCLV